MRSYGKGDQAQLELGSRRTGLNSSVHIAFERIRNNFRNFQLILIALAEYELKYEGLEDTNLTTFYLGRIEEILSKHNYLIFHETKFHLLIDGDDLNFKNRRNLSEIIDLQMIAQRRFIDRRISKGAQTI